MWMEKKQKNKKQKNWKRNEACCGCSALAWSIMWCEMSCFSFLMWLYTYWGIEQNLLYREYCVFFSFFFFTPLITPPFIFYFVSSTHLHSKFFVIYAFTDIFQHSLSYYHQYSSYIYVCTYTYTSSNVISFIINWGW